MVPAMRVFRPAVAKRVMLWMPDSPAVSFAQSSGLAAPSDVTMPVPVTTTTGRPCLSFAVAIVVSSAGRLDNRQTFAAPVPDPGYHHLAQRAGHGLFQPGRVSWRKQPSMAEGDRSESDVHDELWFRPVPEIGACSAHGKIVMR